MRRNGTTALAMLALLVGAGCGGAGGAGEGAWQGSMTDSAGVSIVTNTSQGVWNGGQGWDLEEVMRIGSSGGDADYQFGNISGIAVASDSRIFVLDQQAGEIRVFTADGVFEQSIGRSGSGPGELGTGAGPLFLAGIDTLVVPDLANQRVNLFGTDGSMLGSYRLELQEGIPVRWEPTPSGNIVAQMRSFALPNQPEPDTMDAIVARAADGTIRDTLMRVPAGKTFQFGGGGAPEFNFFTAEPAWTLTSDTHLMYGVNSEYRIGLYDGSGNLQRVISKPFERAPVTERDQELFTAALERAWQNAGVPPQALPTLVQGINFAESYPAYLQFHLGPRETLWVQHIISISLMSEEALNNLNPLLSLGAPEWDVFDPEGRFLGTLSMPAGFQPVRFVGEQIYGIWRDELEVQHVMALRITGLPGSDSRGMPVGE